MTVIAVDIGGTKLSVAAVDRNYAVVAGRSSAAGDSAETIVADVVSMIRDVAGELGLRAYGLGVAVAGLVDGLTGTVLVSPNLPLGGFALKKELEAQLQVPTMVDNDAGLAALGEITCGAARGEKDVIALTLGTGIGGGIIVDGKLYRGSLGTAAEVGHMVIIADGPVCGCGRRGCLEALASGRAIERMAIEYASEHRGSPVDMAVSADGSAGPRLAELARKGDEAALSIFNVAADYLGIGIGNLVNVLVPGKVIIGGGMAEAWDLFAERTRRGMLAVAIDPRAGAIEIVTSSLGNQAGLMGAAAMVRELLGATT